MADWGKTALSSISSFITKATDSVTSATKRASKGYAEKVADAESKLIEAEDIEKDYLEGLLSIMGFYLGEVERVEEAETDDLLDKALERLSYAKDSLGAWWASKFAEGEGLIRELEGWVAGGFDILQETLELKISEAGDFTRNWVDGVLTGIELSLQPALEWFSTRLEDLLMIPAQAFFQMLSYILYREER